MLDRIFPRQFDNRYRGHWLGLALFVLVLIVKALQGVNSIIWTREIMAGADGIPIDTFSAAAADSAILMFALLGMYLLVLPLQSIIVLIRYRSMVPFMLLILLAVQFGARGIHFLHPDTRSNPGGGEPIGLYVNLGILAVTVVAFVLSISGPRPQAGALPEAMQ
ncbi:MAG TPA: hypothetical protein VHW69_10210 [Rhizomicrobium sp.]|jgi:hypothetical protein|nr:hypothetical protein [Rhizomicrobium sp.]